MTEKLISQMNKEILIFVGLAVVNIVFAALVLALGVIFVINHIFILIESEWTVSIHLAYVIAGFALGLIGFWWILPSSSLMDLITDIKLEYYKEKGQLSDEKTISLIIKMISYFRQHAGIINKMIFISRAGGLIFIANGIISSVNLYYNYSSTFQLSNHTMQIAAIILVFSWGTIGILLPRIISNYASIWDYRLNEIKKAEEIMREKMES